MEENSPLFAHTEGHVLGIFMPIAFHDRDMDQLTVYTKDASTVTEWLGIVCLEPIRDSYTHRWVGFHLTGAKALRGRKKRVFMPAILLTAWWHDIFQNEERTIGRWRLSLAYLSALALLLRRPRALVLR